MNIRVLGQHCDDATIFWAFVPFAFVAVTGIAPFDRAPIHWRQ